MNIKQHIAQNKLVLFIRLLGQYLPEILLFSKELGQANTKNNHKKYKARLTIEFHSIEKGLSIGGARVGFGQEKIISAIKNLSDFYLKFYDSEFVLLNLAIVDKYLDFNETKKNELPQIIQMRNNLYNIIESQKNSCSEVGVITKNKLTVLKSTHSDFSEFSNSRFSIRDFNSEEPVDKQKIYDALEIAMKTPSACNRQPWCIHLFSGNKKNQLLEYQGGCKGFIEQIEYAILLSVDLNMYFINEINQPYVDGGIYGMNLLYALHYKGLATIPLTTGFKQRKLNKLKERFDIPANETPVMIIGIGSYKNEYKVAVSHRIAYEKYFTEH